MISKKFHINKTRIAVVPSIGYGIGYLHSAFVQEDFSDSASLGGRLLLVTRMDLSDTESPSYNRIDHGIHFQLRVEKTIVSNHFIFLESAFYHGMRDYDQVNISKNRNLNFNIGFGYTI